MGSILRLRFFHLNSREFSLVPGLLVLLHSCFLGVLLKCRVIQKVWAAWPKSSQVTSMLLLEAPHFEKQDTKECFQIEITSIRRVVAKYTKSVSKKIIQNLNKVLLPLPFPWFFSTSWL